VTDGAIVTGIGFSTKPPDEALELVRQDPSITAGLESVNTATYTFPKGVLAFPRADRDL